MESPSAPDSAYKPAAYGRACVGCSKAKCKCFYRSDASGCERCHRLRKVCEPSAAVRQRRTRKAPSTAARLEEKLDDLVSYLRSQDSSKRGALPTQPSSANDNGASGASTSIACSGPACGKWQDADVVLDTTTGFVHIALAAPNSDSPGTPWSPIFQDISLHKVPDGMAEEQLGVFRRSFLPMFPFIHIPSPVSAQELRRQRPFLWLVIMALTSTQVSQQFAMEETFWQIVSRRVVAQREASMDLLLGIMCFASWCHYFKKTIPEIVLLTQLAVSLAFDLGIHKGAPEKATQLRVTGRVLPGTQIRTMEERRTLVALFLLTSIAWITMRKTEPLRWTSYMDDCVRTLGEKRETDLDLLLVTYVRCHLITNPLIRSPADDPPEGEATEESSPILMKAMLTQLEDIRRSMPQDVLSDRNAQLTLQSTELAIRQGVINKPRGVMSQTAQSNLQRLAELEALLSGAERWLEIFFSMPLADWVGINTSNFGQFTHCLTILFKLSNLDEPGWDTEMVRGRADLLEVIDRYCESMERVPAVTGMVDASGPRSGLMFKTAPIMRLVKDLFAAEMRPKATTGAVDGPSGSADAGEADEFTADSMGLPDDVLAVLAEEPWFTDIFVPSWDFDMDVDPTLVPGGQL
ncbi:Zn2/Cys6 DNA-binding protein [Pleurostoma richardsiae]|uniref:Zn2/Cys6 DNA-binding protein n=1 Tax=Pleurostoma richardsiae TaxID=41990 RepID=A0AA38R6A2_9PEZI|nr:Zn2/Cys6 DNA-binding protein [Pleurostoma richardsiae]